LHQRGTAFSLALAPVFLFSLPLFLFGFSLVALPLLVLLLVLGHSYPLLALVSGTGEVPRRHVDKRERLTSMPKSLRQPARERGEYFAGGTAVVHPDAFTKHTSMSSLRVMV
jgi:hypothetical protein